MPDMAIQSFGTIKEAGMAKIIKKRIDVAFTEEDYKFIEWLAKKDDMTVQEELKTLFYQQWQASKDLYLEEMEWEEQA